jgi:POT family proton-dependent oligopeptide transporter
MSALDASPAYAGARTWIGHPKGLFFLAFTEAWERFSYYGMVALVVLYMVNQLLLPGHFEHIAGLATLRAALESVSGPLSPQALASQIFGLYTGFVYFTPLVGGMIADRWIGQRSAVVIGALLMSSGHLAMSFDQTFLLALVLLVIGSGFLKGNIAAQVGALYSRYDDARRSRGFVIFNTGINFGAVCGPLACGLIAQIYGWSFGFGTAAIFMLVGLATYLYGYRYLPVKVPRDTEDTRAADIRLTSAEWRTIRAVIAVMLITIFQSVAFNQRANVIPVWIEDYVAPSVGGFTIPVPWYQSIDSIFSILGVPLLFMIWQRQATRRGEPHDLAKIRTGALLAAASNLILVAAIAGSGGARINPIWPFLYFASLGIAFLYYWPTLLALVSRAAPIKVNATLMGMAYLTLFVANNLVGWIGGFYERMTPSRYWTMHAAIAAGGALLVTVFERRLRQALDTVAIEASMPPQ